ncbi:FimV/HubP family polar landmark protein, partial [Vibrio gallaecicus]
SLEDEELDDFSIDDLELPEFGEEEALADFESGLNSEQQEAVPSSVELPDSESLEDEELDDFSIDDLELPEFGEEEALADFESGLNSEQQEAAPLSVEQPASESLEDEDLEDFSIDDLELPEFGEEEALADFESGLDSEQQETAPSAVEQPAPENLQDEELDEFSFDDLELPEFGEEEALTDSENILDAEPEVGASLQDVAQGENKFEELGQEIESLAEPVEEVLPSNEDSHAPEEGSTQEELPDDISPIESEADEDFTFDDLELPEFDEADALAEAISSGDEELLEQDLTSDLEAFEFDDKDLPEYDEESAKADSAVEPGDSDESLPVSEEFGLEIDELELPEYGEDDAISDAFSESAPIEAYSNETEVNETADNEIEVDSSESQLTEEVPQEKPSESFLDVEGNDQDALHDLFSNPSTLDTPDSLDSEQSELGEYNSDKPNTENLGFDDELLDGFDNFDETALAELLSEDVQDSVDNMFSQPMDSTSIDSAGLDLEAMLEVGGEDWNGFSLSPDQKSELPNDVPADQQEVWESLKQQSEPKIQEENWGQQENLTEQESSSNSYMTIDELMAQVEGEGEALNPDEEELKLDVGLNEFPDVIGDIGDIDVDSNAEAAGKLDLAKIYIEMSDPQGAIKLLEEAIVDGSDDIRREAKNLIDVLNGR